MTSGVELRVQGKTFDLFKSGAVQLSMEEPANSFDLEYVADGKIPGVRAIFAGDTCTLALDGEVVLDGYVDGTEDTDEAESITLAAVGRSKTCDLVDCSAVSKPRSWSNATLTKIAKDLCAPFGISVTVDGDEGKPFDSFAVHHSEAAIETIGRAATKRGLFPYCVGGGLVLARAGSTKSATVLERGKNVARWARSESFHSRFSDYVFRAQAPATDNNFGKKASQIKSTVRDAAVTRYRPIAVRKGAHDGIDLETHAKLERNQRAGRGERISALVPDWKDDAGKLWRPNTLVRVKNPVLGVEATLLIVSVRFRFGERESRAAVLDMTRPEAFDMAKYPALGRGLTWT